MNSVDLGWDLEHPGYCREGGHEIGGIKLCFLRHCITVCPPSMP